MPPISTSFTAFSTASAKSFARYMASVGESFSCAKGSLSSIALTSPIRILVSAGTLTPAISAILIADCPTIAAFNAPFFSRIP
ncbi:hypothetical protein SB6421_05827 [Klebsiella huaxiensis]|nr:hypothetical protein SB6421_05827 [Klebsiella huaxiensis]